MMASYDTKVDRSKTALSLVEELYKLNRLFFNKVEHQQ
jgi:23S rRNA G2069 N7-methylase RlmK/C1962 C5-methylase RlmI